MITSDGFFELEDLPKKVAVIGGGYIAVEMAGIFKSLGSDVTVVIRKPLILNGFDQDLRMYLQEEMKASGINFLLETNPTRVEKDPRGLLNLTVTVSTKGVESTIKGLDTILSATGRIPVSKNIGLEDVGVQLDNQGHIKVDEYQNTSVPGIYALGDVCGQFQLTPGSNFDTKPSKNFES